MCNLTLDHVKIIQCNLDYLDHVYPEPSWLSGQAGDQKIHHHAMHRRYGQWSFVGVVTGWVMSYSKSTLVLTHPWLRSLLTCLGQNWLTRALFWILRWPLSYCMGIIYSLGIINQVKNVGTSVIQTYFTYPVCQWSACGQRSPEYRGCTVISIQFSMCQVGNSTIYLSN